MEIKTSKIVPAVDSIPSKKKDLRNAITSLQSYTSCLDSFSREWKALDTQFSSIEKSIEKRFRDLEAKESCSIPEKPASALPAMKVKEEKDEIKPRPELKALCAKMDSKGLRSYIMENRKDIKAINRELGPALLSASNPVAMVLDSLVGFFPSKKEKDEDTLSVRRNCVSLLECLQGLVLEIKPSDRKRAESVAKEWKRKISDEIGDHSLVALGFLLLVGIFGLVDSFLDEVLDRLVVVARRKQTVDLCRSLGIEHKMPDYVEKLKSKGKQVDAVKFVFAFNLSDKYPPVSLLKAYVKESNKFVQEVRQKGNYSRRALNEAIAKEIAALQAVIKVVEEYKLGSIYQCENLHKRIEQLAKEKAEKKRTAAAVASTYLNQHQPNKRLRPSVPAAPVGAVHLQPHKQTQLGLVDRAAAYMGLGSSYSLSAAPPIYDHGGASISGNLVGLGGHHASALKSHLYSSDSLVGSGYYNKPVSYGGYSVSALSAPYNPSLYP